MNDFYADYDWQNKIRERLLLPHYQQLHDKKIFSRWRNSETKYEQTRGDALFKLLDGSVIGIEEKIVRWPGYQYEDITLETMSCSLPGLEVPGWMVTAQYGWLIHIRVNETETEIDCDAFLFKPLKQWFSEQNHNQWKLVRMESNNRTESRKVPLNQIRDAIRTVKFSLPKGSAEHLFSLTYARIAIERKIQFEFISGQWP